MSVTLQVIEAELEAPALVVGFPDYIVAKLKLENRSQRWLADETGISRSRMQRLLCGDPAQRKPLRLQEKQAIFEALKVDEYAATLATELMGLDAESEFEATVAIASMLSGLFRGLMGQVATALRHIKGFEHHDIREEYGVVMKDAVVRTIQTNFQEIAARRGLRLDQLFASDRSSR
ncbi:hypothetical protein [uncultured Sphingomonas sp.]|uniref:hypothetical protein n=1 Tax=uncultured Sphingomonas sp. TaxID=158754 RepID=UPI0035CB43AA